MTDVTQLLSAAHNGDRQAAAELLPLVYDELRKLAAAKMFHEEPGHTFDAANQLETSVDASGVTTYTFDDDGNQRVTEEPSGDRTTHAWDYENKNTLTLLPDGSRMTMTYNPDGIRVRKMT